MWKQKCGIIKSVGTALVSLQIDKSEHLFVSVSESVLQLYNAFYCSIVNDIKYLNQNYQRKIIQTLYKIKIKVFDEKRISLHFR